MIGKTIRMKRIFKDGKTLISALDYGGFMGPVQGIENPDQIVSKVVDAGADAVLLNPGIAASEWETFAGKCALILRITGGCSCYSPDMSYHTVTSSVKEAVRLGADAVAVMVIVGAKEEHRMFRNMGYIIEEARDMGMPVLAELLPADKEKSFDKKAIGVCARVGYELGADIIKTYYPGEGFQEIVSSCPVPIVIAGGPKLEDPLVMVRSAILSGARGVAFGRNIFQSEKPELVVHQIRQIIHA